MNLKEDIKQILRPTYRNFLALRNKGNKIACNICGCSFDKLKPVSGRHADGSSYIIEGRIGICWKCNSYARMRKLWFWLVNNYKIHEQENINILHIAPELPVSAKLRKFKDITYTCLDKHCIGYTYPKYVLNGDVCKLSFNDKCFDLIICNHVLEHIKDDTTALSEIFRTLKDDGTAILMVPINMDLEVTDEESAGETLTSEERESRFGQYDHVRIYGTDYFDRLKRAGFNVSRIQYPSEINRMYGMSPDEELIVCTK